MSNIHSGGFRAAVTRGQMLRHSNGFRSVGTLLAVTAAAVSCGGGCGALQPYSLVLQELPPEELLRIDEQWVHVEDLGAGDPVVFVHGFGASTFSWRDVLPAMSESYRAVALDLNGFGYTERPTDPQAYTIEGQAGLVAAVMDRLGLEDAHIVGHSYGAGVVLYLAATSPERVRSLTLVDGGVLTSESGGPDIPEVLQPFTVCLVRTFFLNAGQVRRALRSAVYDPSVVTEAMVQGYLDRLRIEGLDRALNGLLDAAGDFPSPDPASLEVPTLVLWGREDPVFSLEAGESLAASIPGAELVVLDRTGHLPMEERPEEFVAALDAFLSTMP